MPLPPKAAPTPWSRLELASGSFSTQLPGSHCASVARGLCMDIQVLSLDGRPLHIVWLYALALSMSCGVFLGRLEHLFIPDQTPATD